MSSRSSGRANGQSHEDQTAEMISNLTMTQLLYILQRIRQLSFHSQEYAKKLLTESPQLCLALIHAQYIVSGKKLDSHLLPLTADEIKMSHDRLNLIRMMDANPNAHMGVIGSGSSAPADVGLSRKFSTAWAVRWGPGIGTLKASCGARSGYARTCHSRCVWW